MPNILMENRQNEYFLLPSFLIERYLTVCSHNQLKVILWLLKNSSKTTQDTELARYLDMELCELEDSIKYWLKEGVLIKNGERLSLNVGRMGLSDAQPQYTSEIIANKIKEEPRLANMIKRCEEIFTKLLSPNEAQTLYSLYDYRGLLPEVIVLLVEHCFEEGKSGIRYIEKVGVSWSAMGIDSVKKAEKYLTDYKNKKTLTYRIAKTIGASERALTTSEEKNIALWIDEYNFDLDIIKKAYDLTIEKTGKYSISYLSTILKAWYEKGFKNITDTENERAPTKKGKKETSYDLEETFKNAWKVIHND